MKILRFWYKEFPQFPITHRDYWRVVLVFHCLLIASVVPLILCVINVLFFSSYDLALFDAAISGISFLAYMWFRSTGNVIVASICIAVTVTVAICLFVYLTKGYSHSVVWMLVIPPITYFLVGRRWGTVYSGLAFMFCAYIVYQQVGVDFPKPQGMGAFLNVVEACTVIVLLFRFYEKTRSQAYLQLQERNTLVTELAQTDRLTGLYNREKFDCELKQGQHSALCLLLVDVDHFKKINDTYGHLKGDEVLKSMARILQEQVRSGDVVARWGGEEFAILLQDTTQEHAFALAERIRETICSTKIAGLSISVSAGLAVSNTSVYEPDKLLRRADKALYQAKSGGRNRVVAA